MGRTVAVILALCAVGWPAAAGAPRLLHARQLDRQDDLIVVDLDGGESRRLTDHPAKDCHGVLSPDGRRIVFNSERVGWWKIWVMNADGSDPTQLTRPESGADYYPDWSPDGERIVFVSGGRGNGDIIVMDADGSDATNLTDHPARDNFPAWSPDGRWIAFASDREDGWAIYVTDPTGETVRRVSGEGDALEPAWYPDSRRLVYQVATGGSFDLYAVELTPGATPVRLTRHPGAEKRPAVSPDGRLIAFESDRAGGSQIFVMAADGGDARQVTRDGYNYGPSWFAPR